MADHKAVSGAPEQAPGGGSSARRSRRMLAAMLSCVAVGGLAFGALLSVYLLNRPTGGPPREVTVQKGMTVAQIARLLYRDGVIRSPRLLRIFSVLNGTSRRLTAGVHPFLGEMTTWEVLLELEVPRDITRDVTIPEGLRRVQTIRILAQSLNLDEARLDSLTTDPEFCRSLGVHANTLEGYLFPETYRFSLSMDEAAVIKTMVHHFFQVFNDSMQARAQQIGMTTNQVVTLASIIEGEAQLDSERPLISAVYHNRLKRHMRLQADPTVQYALGGEPRRLFDRDYEVDSPYNTYLHKGLPPGPILSPGARSLHAALYPAHVDYLYFVARGDGSHIFSRTMREHDAAKRRTRRARLKLWQESRGQ